MGRGRSLRARFLMVALACLVPLLIVVLYVLYESVGNGRDQLLDAQGATAEVVSKVLASTLDDNEAVLTELASIDKVRRIDASSADALDQFKRARPSLYGLFLVQPNGELVATSGIDPAQFAAIPSFKDSMDRALKLGETGISGRLVAPDAEMIAITVPVRAKDGDTGTPIGALGGLLSIERLKDNVLPFVSGDTEVAIVEHGDVIAAQGTDLRPADLAGALAQPIAQAASGKMGTHVYQDSDGNERLAAFSPVPGADWVVLVTHPAPNSYAPNRMLIQRALAALGLATLATLAIVLFLGEWMSRPVRQLTAQASRLADGDYGVQIEPTGHGEIAVLGDAVREMAGQLVAKVRDLEAAQEEDAYQADQMRDLNRRTVRLQEDERRRIAGEIHDAVAPLITGALYQTRALKLGLSEHAVNGIGNGRSHEATRNDLGDELGSIADLLTRAHEELHGVIFALRPPDLDDIGVVAAIERYMAQVQRSGLTCRLELIGEQASLSPEVRLAVYRIVQEALHNALRHAAADEAVVRIEQSADWLRVTIRDNGAGFNPELAQRPTALGLLSMRERAAAIGAAFSIASRPGDGTTVTIERWSEPVPAPETSEPVLEPMPPWPAVDELIEQRPAPLEGGAARL